MNSACRRRVGGIDMIQGPRAAPPASRLAALRCAAWPPRPRCSVRLEDRGPSHGQRRSWTPPSYTRHR
eukprot:366573-Chlamydomonas_euryale.AAC.3